MRNPHLTTTTRTTDIEPERPQLGVKDFLQWFRERGAQCRMPCPHFTAEDYGIAARLLKRHGRERLEKLAEYFWHWHSEPLREGYTHPLKLFASAISEIEAAIQ